MKRWVLFLCAALIMAITSAANADQGEEYEVIVLDPKGEPVKDATVEVTNLGISVKTGANGKATLKAPQGEFMVKVTAKDLEPLEEPVEFNNAAAASGIELLMEYSMGNVVITGTKTEKLIEKAPVKTEVITREDIEKKKAANLAEVLDETTGVRVESDCQNCSFTQVRLNGLEGQYTQILINGKQVTSSLSNVYILEQIPQELIERVEIIKGGGSALYGGNAVGGVINIITKKPYKNFGTVDARYSAIGMEQPEMRVGGNAGVVNKDKTAALHVYGNVLTRQPWDANDDDYSEIGKNRGVNAGADAFFDLTPDLEVQLKYHTLYEQRRGGDLFDKPEHDSNIAESITTSRQGGELQLIHWAHKHFNYSLGYGIGYTERNSYYGGGGDLEYPEVADPENLTAQEQEDLANWALEKQGALGAYGRTKSVKHAADMTLNNPFSVGSAGDMVLTYGAQYELDDLQDSYPGYGRAIDGEYSDIGGFLQVDWLYASWGELLIGARADKHSELEETMISPRAALMFTPTQWLRLRTAYSTGFRPPQPFDEDFHITVVSGEGFVIYTDNDELEAEKSMSISQQIEFDLDLANGWKVTAGLNGFYTQIENLFSVDEQDDPTTPDEIEAQRINIDGSTTVMGGEVEFGLAYKKIWDLNTGWTFEQTELSEEEPDFGETVIYRTPDYYGFISTSVRPFGGLEIATSLDFTGPMKVPHYAGYIDEDVLEETDMFVDWDANLSYRIDIRDSYYWQPYVGMRNILDAYQDDFDEGPDRDAGYVYGPRLPRTFFAGLKAGF